LKIEAGTLVTPVSVVENACVEVAGAGSMYVETLVTPGFSDSHAHPQVVDVGGGRWRNAYEWIRGRRLAVDEASVREDLALSSKLSMATMLLEMVEGATLVAMVGRSDANMRAYRRLPVKPRLVTMPTILAYRRGWPSTRQALELVARLAPLNGSVAHGLFIHSLGYVDEEALRLAYRYSRERGLPMGLHLSEGVRELEKLVNTLSLERGCDSGIIAVHCIEDEPYLEYGIRVVHCPSSNMALYGRTISDVRGFEALGSDWPLLLGGALSTYRQALEIHGRAHALDILRKATHGGYSLFKVRWTGDFTAFDEPLGKVLEGEAEPRFVAVNGEIVVAEGRIAVLGLDKHDVAKIVEEARGEALERYPA